MRSERGTSPSENATKPVAFRYSLKVQEVSPFSLEFQTKHEQNDDNNVPEKGKPGKGRDYDLALQ